MKKIVPVYPWPMHAKVADVVEAIENITPVQALPGGPGPVLSIKVTPPFVCDALVVTDPSAVEAAVRIITEGGVQLVTVRDQISAVFGTVREFVEPPKVSFK